MKLPRLLPTGLVFVAVFTATFSPVERAKAEEQVDRMDQFRKSHQAGVRLGAWSNLGDLPPRETLEGSTTVTSKVKNGSFLFEAYFAYRLFPAAMIELSAGVANRGTVSITDSLQSDVGNLMIYPILLQAKLYPLAGSNIELQPYLLGGGGLYYGRRTVQFVSNQSFFVGSGLDQESGTDFNFVVGGGIDWPIHNSIALDLSLKYMPVSFSNQLVSVTDYEAVAFGIGIKYLYRSKNRN
ncbi:MAG: hypothetical protein ACE5FH_07810 [Candidatus Zixiibacteriota bacterium]